MGSIAKGMRVGLALLKSEVQNKPRITVPAQRMYGEICSQVIPPVRTSCVADNASRLCGNRDLRQPPVRGIPLCAPHRACGAMCVWQKCKCGELYWSSWCASTQAYAAPTDQCTYSIFPLFLFFT